MSLSEQAAPYGAARNAVQRGLAFVPGPQTAEAVGAAAESAAVGARDRGRMVAAAVVDAAPGGGDRSTSACSAPRKPARPSPAGQDQALEAARESTIAPNTPGR